MKQKDTHTLNRKFVTWNLGKYDTVLPPYWLRRWWCLNCRTRMKGGLLFVRFNTTLEKQTFGFTRRWYTHALTLSVCYAFTIIATPLGYKLSFTHTHTHAQIYPCNRHTPMQTCTLSQFQGYVRIYVSDGTFWKRMFAA